MEINSLKALALKFLKGNRQGNRMETKSFLAPKNEEEISTPKETVKQGKKHLAAGYGCGLCGHNIYQRVLTWETELATGSWTHEHRPAQQWRCEGCGATYQLIGGSRGPVYTN